MGYRLHEIEAESKFSQELTFEAIGQAVTMAAVEAALQAEGVETAGPTPTTRCRATALSHTAGINWALSPW